MISFPHRRSALTLLALFAVAPLLHAQEKYPSRLVRIVVPFAAGGPGDILARTLAPLLADNLGQQVIVENRAGGDAIPGTQFVAKAPADGYTILQLASAQIINMVLRDKAPYDLLRDFAPVARVGETALVLVTPATLPARTVGEFVSYAKSKPEGISFASGGAGSGGHLAAELFIRSAGIAAVHVPYKGMGAAMQDLIGGRTEFAFQTPAESRPQVIGGRLRALAVTSAQRAAVLPDTPTMTEAGFRAVNPTVSYGYMVPRGTPETIVRQLQEALLKAMAVPAVQERLVALGITPTPGGAQELTETVKQEVDRWTEVVKDAKIRVE